MTHTTHHTPHTPHTPDTGHHTLPTPGITKNGADLITLLRLELTDHCDEAQHLLGMGMFYTARTELDKCIELSGRIFDLYTHEE